MFESKWVKTIGRSSDETGIKYRIEQGNQFIDTMIILLNLRND